jgi:hypothetical protein
LSLDWDYLEAQLHEREEQIYSRAEAAAIQHLINAGFANLISSCRTNVRKKKEEAFEKIKRKLQMKRFEDRENNKSGVPAMSARSSKDDWEAIECNHGISKKKFGKKINFVRDTFKRKIIFRDVEDAFVLDSQGFPKASVILAGGVIEELLSQYLAHKSISAKKKTYASYIEACDGLIEKKRVLQLIDSVRDGRNLVHLDREKTKKDTISKSMSQIAVSAIFVIVDNF